MAHNNTEALNQGRRIYVGNVYYHVRPEQVLATFAEHGFGDDQVDKIHISVDPITGRNPGYCFVELSTRDEANAAIERMAGVPIEGRPLKTGPCKPKGSFSKGIGVLKRKSSSATPNRSIKGPIGADEHLMETMQEKQKSQVFVGGLGKKLSQQHNEEDLMQIFEGFKVTAVGKHHTTSERATANTGNHSFAFVDLEDEDEAQRAIATLNGRVWKDGRLKVRIAHDAPGRIQARGTRYRDEG